MRGRFLALGAVLLATGIAGVAPSEAASTDPVLREDPADDRFRLTCSGAMSTDGRAVADADDPAARIIADALVDFTNHRVTGFGLGSSPIVGLTAGAIRFGTAHTDTMLRVAEALPARTQAATGTIVEGTIDRKSGATRIVVRPAADAARVIIAMSLDCSFEPAPR